jgi:hypothetical protein
MLSETAMNTDLAPQPQDKLHSMTTNEEQRNIADRRIPLTSSDLLFEVLGNMSGDERHLWFDKDDKCLYTFHNDEGFSPKDETAIQGKNLSGNNTHTVGYNGHGIKLAIDKLLPDDNEIALASIYSINTKRTCKLGHFKFKVWRNWDNEDEIAVAYILQKLGVESMSGSVFKIPLNDEFIDEYEKDNNNDKDHCRMFLNIKIARQDVTFYWNGVKQSVSEICPQKGALTINYTVGYDVKDVKITDLNPIHKKTTILRINSYEELDERVKDIIPEYINLVQTTKSLVPYDVAHTFEPLETAEMVLNLVKTEKPAPVGAFQENWIDGCLPYINNTCIAYKAITQSLGYNHGVSKNNYGGLKPRFAHHISKNTHHYSVPVDKAHITPTKYIGDRVLRCMNIIAKIAFGISTTSTPSTPTTTTSTTSTTSTSSTSAAPAPRVTTPTRTPAPRVTTPTRTPAPAASSTSSTNNRTPADNFTPKQGADLRIESDQSKQRIYMITKGYIEPEAEVYVRRCNCCYRILRSTHEVVGHITSHNHGGKPEMSNGIIICSSCNNNDTRNIPQMMIDDYGIDSFNTIRFEQYLIQNKKNGADIIPKEREQRRLLAM